MVLALRQALRVKRPGSLFMLFFVPRTISFQLLKSSVSPPSPGAVAPGDQRDLHRSRVVTGVRLYFHKYIHREHLHQTTRAFNANELVERCLPNDLKPFGISGFARSSSVDGVSLFLRKTRRGEQITE